jgi:hypothetical protein
MDESAALASHSETRHVGAIRRPVSIAPHRRIWTTPTSWHALVARLTLRTNMKGDGKHVQPAGVWCW